MLLERTEILQSESETRLLRLEEKTIGDKAQDKHAKFYGKEHGFRARRTLDSEIRM